jgi:CheY-like chemotaxis protein
MLKAPIIGIIDDDESVREATKGLIRSLGYNAAIFASAEEYLRSDCVSNSACLITDLNMPGMSGADLQDHLIAEGRHVPIIFITAYSDEKVRVRVLDAGAFGFLRKPFDDEDLIECLNKALKQVRHNGIIIIIVGVRCLRAATLGTDSTCCPFPHFCPDGAKPLKYLHSLDPRILKVFPLATTMHLPPRPRCC